MAETKKKEECNIYQKLQMIQVDMKAPKDLYNKFGNYAYRNAESICEAVKPFERDILMIRKEKKLNESTTTE